MPRTLAFVLLDDVAAASETVGATSARGGKIAALADALRLASPEEAAIAVAFLSGELRQRQIGVGWAALQELPAPAAEPSLGLGEVDAAFARIGALSGAGSQGARRAALAELFARATEREQRFLRALLSGGIRQGALEGVMADAAAKAAEVPAAELRRAVMLHGDLGEVAATAMAGGVPALREIGLQVGRGIRPMLASPAADIDVAMEKLSPAAVEWKLDGIRAQVHRDGNDVAVFSRTLDDITERVPGIVESALALPVRSVVLDGEAIALREDGRPHAFQDTASRGHQLQALYFDVLHLDGEDVLDEPGSARAERLAAVVPEALRVPRLVAADAEAANAVLDEALAMGHEGVIVKSLDAPYAAGRRGAGWLKVKPVHTLDLVILAAEWGHGRRRGWLSNLHLGARHDTEPGQFVMLGKTFKGLTDKMLQWQTEALLELATDRGDWVVHVRPELVVEIAFDGIQRSTRYPGGVALRFARVLRHRPDKRAEEADTLASVLAVA
jgi:ATP-dependent DNA ligase I